MKVELIISDIQLHRLYIGIRSGTEKSPWLQKATNMTVGTMDFVIDAGLTINMKTKAAAAVIMAIQHHRR